jgi:hypothetical protein
MISQPSCLLFFQCWSSVCLCCEEEEEEEESRVTIESREGPSEEVVIVIQIEMGMRRVHSPSVFLVSVLLGIWEPNMLWDPPARLLAEVFANRDFGFVLSYGLVRCSKS